jgi:hypothetical protein
MSLVWAHQDFEVYLIILTLSQVCVGLGISLLVAITPCLHLMEGTMLGDSHPWALEFHYAQLVCVEVLYFI